MNIKDQDIRIAAPTWTEPKGYTQVMVCKTRGLYSVGAMAAEIATRFALVAAEPDGEDAAGRQKMRMPSALELAQRSCEIAQALWAEFENREWFFDVPLPEKIKEKETETA